MAALTGMAGIGESTAQPQPEIRLEVIAADPEPVLDESMPGTEDNLYGFEGGTVVRTEGTDYHLVTAERFDDPIIVKMRLAHWTSPDGTHWARKSTLFESSGDFTGQDARAALWGPMPVFDASENRWNLFYVAYRAKPNTPDAWYENHEGRIWRAVSTVQGRHGVGGPYRDDAVVLEPGPQSQAWEGLQGVDSFFPYPVGDRWLAFYGSAHTQVVPCPFWGTGLAEAESLSGPWRRRASGNPVKLDAVFAENPVVLRAGGLWVALVDGGHINQRFGYATSRDGLTWSRAEWIDLSQSIRPWWGLMRTPLCLLPEEDGTHTIFYTALRERPGKQSFGAVGRVRVRLLQR